MKKWQTVAADPAGTERLQQECGLPRPMAAVLAGRGINTADEVRQWMNPRLADLRDPSELAGVDEATRLIRQAIEQQDSIAVYGDYDVDGVTATALLTTALRACGAARVTPFIPSRLEEGYGLGTDAVKRCIEQCQPRLVITVDCGTNSGEAARYLRDARVKLIVTDHHEPDEVAPADALINPKRNPHPATANLSGVGVAFKLCHALVKQARADQRPGHDFDLREHLDWVALGTICDIVPLTHENRILAARGLEKLNQPNLAGLQALLRVARVKPPLDTYHVGFILGPRLNAAGRLDDAMASLELLTTHDPDRAAELAQALDDANHERQAIEAATFLQAQKQIESWYDARRDYGLVVAGENWHPGVVGIVAARLVSKYHRPAIVIALDLTEGKGRGSCRSIEGFSMIEHLNQCAPLLLKWGGHHMAAGVQLEAAHWGDFRGRFNEVAAATLQERDLTPIQRVDAWVGFDEINDTLMSAIQRLEPYGLGNPRPVWALRGALVAGEPRVVGKEHLRLTLADQHGHSFPAMGFGMAQHVKVAAGMRVDAAFHLVRNEYEGQSQLELRLQDLQPAVG